MERILKWIGFDVDGIVQKRREQLERQATIDALLERLPCQDAVAKYLLLQREQNRAFCKEYEGLSYTEYYSTTQKHLEVLDKELDSVEMLFSICTNPCERLKTMNKRTKMA